MNNIRFAVLGCGHIGKRHAQIIEQHPQATLAALIDDKELSSLHVQEYNAPFFDSLKNFFESNTPVDVMIIATPNGLHAQHAIECLQHNIHVVIEKPMALNTSDAVEIISTAKNYKKQVFVVKQNRYAPPVTWLKQVVEHNILGEIFLVQLNCFWNRDERYYKKNSWHGAKAMDGGTLYTQFSHFIDIFYWLFGDIKNIKSKFESFNHKQLTAFEDSGVITFEFGKKSIGCLQFSTAVWHKNFESSISVIAENGTIKIGGQYMDVIEYCHIKNYKMPQLHALKESNHYYVIQNVIDVLQHTKSITNSATEALKVVEIIERIYKSAE